VVTRRKKPEPPADDETHHSQASKPKGRHWLEYAIFIFVIATTVATGWAAYFTQQQWEVTSDQEKRQLRAYVGIVPGDVENLGDIGKQTWNASRKNYGQTPAYDVAIVAYGQSIIHTGEPIPTNPPLPPPDIRGAITLFPTADLALRLKGIAINKEKLTEFLNADGFQLVYFGTIQYHDIFDQRHFTYFCWMYSRDHPNGKDAEGCLGHNDSN
jgi:hypothetical protein